MKIDTRIFLFIFPFVAKKAVISFHLSIFFCGQGYLSFFFLKKKKDGNKWQVLYYFFFAGNFSTFLLQIFWWKVLGFFFCFLRTIKCLQSPLLFSFCKHFFFKKKRKTFFERKEAKKNLHHKSPRPHMLIQDVIYLVENVTGCSTTKKCLNFELVHILVWLYWLFSLSFFLFHPQKK